MYLHIIIVKYTIYKLYTPHKAVCSIIGQDQWSAKCPECNVNLRPRIHHYQVVCSIRGQGSNVLQVTSEESAEWLTSASLLSKAYIGYKRAGEKAWE